MYSMVTIVDHTVSIFSLIANLKLSHIHTKKIIMWGDESESEACSVVSDSLWSHGLYSPWNSPGQNTGVSSLSLLWGIFPSQGSNPGLLHCRCILYQLSQKGSLFEVTVCWSTWLGESFHSFHVYQIMYPSVQFSCSVVSDSLQPHGLQPARLLCPWDSPGKNTGVGCHFLLRMSEIIFTSRQTCM